MAVNSSETKMDNPVVRLLLNFAHFSNPRTPKSKRMQVNYDQIIGGDLTQSVRDMLKLGTQQRRLLVQGLSYAGKLPHFVIGLKKVSGVTLCSV